MPPRRSLCAAPLIAAIAAAHANDFQDAVRASALRTQRCVDTQVRALDDEVSGADVIARAVVTACGAALDEAADVMTYGPGAHDTTNPTLANERNTLRRQVEQDATKQATLAVLQERAHHTR
ncbi:hypothetical protein [Dyella psychrodurans]|uniref:Uncharacterized protein n=1 Tax=Dyella psychrodurans TaxID=1927960 RepID=A0A370XCE0_9GAMM|nr:hypothetical protein [Dyella psychrodurans]RDS85891.1 hypothetical protein DWU99_01035 [Dyella psychrodurans]